jgi:D-3-phosphoglycerate dehydrogenase
MNTLVLAPFSDEGLARLKGLGTVFYEPWTDTQRLHEPEELGFRLEQQDFGALVVEADFLFDELFQAARRLRFAAICRAALNQVDLDSATEHGVAIIHTPGRNANAVAELVLGLMLSLARHIPQAHHYLESGRWEQPTEPYIAFRGRELAGSVLGVIGLGDIGQRTARLGRSIGMRVLAYDPYVRPGSRGTAGITLTSLEKVLTESDFISVHVPETEETTGLLDAEKLALLQPTSYIVNVTSPVVVDTHALASALTKGVLAGAAMDVHEAHPIPPTSPLLGLPNVILTPHIGGATTETIERHSQMVVDDLDRFLAGVRPRHLANRAVWGSRSR